MKIDRNGLVVLERDECIQLLRECTIGRVAVSIGALPAVFPVNFVVAGEDVVFRTGPGTKLAAAMDNTVVAFQADSFEPFSHSGWSVLVTGHATVIEDGAQIVEADRLPLLGWAVHGPHAYVRIAGDVITGRRLDPLLRAAASRGNGDDSPVRRCPHCGQDTYSADNGDAVNFFCASCGRCWHYELGYVSAVDAGTCPGCRFQWCANRGGSMPDVREFALEPLDEAACRTKLQNHHVGRLAVVVDGSPVVVPVNYVSDGSHIVIRTGFGLKLSAARLRDVALQIDSIDLDTHNAWSVLAGGVAFDITDAIDPVSIALRQVPLEPWAPGQKPCWIRIDVDRLSGRRLAEKSSMPVHG